MDFGPFHIDWQNLRVTTTLTPNTLRSIPARVGEVISEPTSNPIAFVLLIAIVLLVILIIVVGIVNLIGRIRRTRLVDTWLVATGEVDTDGEPLYVEVHEDLPPRQRVAHLLTGLAAGLVIIAVMWLAIGAATQSQALCRSCHAVGQTERQTQHVAAGSSNPHDRVSCLRCHEGLSFFGSMTVGVPTRMAHIFGGIMAGDATPSYKAFPRYSCRGCHNTVTQQGQHEVSADGAITMSHYEPLQAGMACSDCHILDDTAKISEVTTGMSSCLHCHNGRVTGNACQSCHTAKTGPYVTAADHQSGPGNAQTLINLPTTSYCYDCHKAKTCDACHGGFRMPHPQGWNSPSGGTHIAAMRRSGLQSCLTCHSRDSFCGGCHEVRSSW
jgi:nitrate/TMAO reductase-like tetraheme cytochrome c subunit